MVRFSQKNLGLKLSGLLLIIGLTGFYYLTKQPPTPQNIIDQYQTAVINLANDNLTAELATSTNQQIIGLSGRPKLPTNQVMLFVYPRADYYGLWMKEMNFPIDVIWLNKQQQIIDQRENLEPETWPEIFRPRLPASLVLELPAGSIQKYQTTIGQKLKIKFEK